MDGRGLLEQTAAAQDLNETGKGFRLIALTLEAKGETSDGFDGAAGVDLQLSVEVVRDGKIGIEGEGTLEGRLGDVWLVGLAAELF